MDKLNQENQEQKQGNSSEKSVWSALSLAWELGYTIALPIVVLALIGRLLDKWWGTSPWLLLTGIFLSILFSSFSVYFKVAKIFILENKESHKKDKEEKKL